MKEISIISRNTYILNGKYIQEHYKYTQTSTYINDTNKHTNKKREKIHGPVLFNSSLTMNICIYCWKFYIEKKVIKKNSLSIKNEVLEEKFARHKVKIKKKYKKCEKIVDTTYKKDIYCYHDLSKVIIINTTRSDAIIKILIIY